MGTKRKAILEAAASEFAQCGREGARVERVSRAAGANKQLIFHYFRSKDGLFVEVLRESLAQATLPRPTASAEGPGMLRAAIAGLAKALRDHRLVASAIIEAGRPPGRLPAADDLVFRWLDDVIGQLREIIEDGQRRGHFREEVDASEVARLSVSACIGLATTDSTAVHPSAAAATLADVMVEHCGWR